MNPDPSAHSSLVFTGTHRTSKKGKGKAKAKEEHVFQLTDDIHAAESMVLGKQNAAHKYEVRHRFVVIAYEDAHCLVRLPWSNRLLQWRSSLCMRATRRISTRMTMSPPQVSLDSCASRPLWYVRSPAGPYRSGKFKSHGLADQLPTVADNRLPFGKAGRAPQILRIVPPTAQSRWKAYGDERA